MQSANLNKCDNKGRRRSDKEKENKEEFPEDASETQRKENKMEKANEENHKMEIKENLQQNQPSSSSNKYVTLPYDTINISYNQSKIKCGQGEICELCGQTFQHVAKHSWRCKKKVLKICPQPGIEPGTPELEGECNNLCTTVPLTCVTKTNNINKAKETTNNKWTKTENKSLMKSYLKARQDGRGYIKRMVQIWRAEHPENKDNEQRLADQIRMLNRTGYFTAIEMSNINIQCGSDNAQVEEENNDDMSEALPAQDNQNQQEDTRENKEDPEVQQLSIAIATLAERMTDSMRIPSLQRADKQALHKITKTINNAVQHLPIYNITQLRKTYQAAAIIACEYLDVKTPKNVRNKNIKKEPPWAFRLKGKIQWIRKTLNQLYQLQENKIRNQRTMKYLVDTVCSNASNIEVKLEELKQQLSVYKYRLEKYSRRQKFYEENKTFEENQGKFFRMIQNQRNRHDEMPINKEQMLKYWSHLWAEPEPINQEAPWRRAAKNHYENTERQSPVQITIKDIRQRARKLHNWKAPGKDGVHNYWIKKLKNLYPSLSNMLNKTLMSNTPSWMLEGRTNLIQKDEAATEFDPSNYRPITCLSTMWKMMSGIISDKVYDHLIDNNIFPAEQKGSRRNVLGTKDQLLINKNIMNHAHKKKRNLATCWIDYRKAYDSIPHEWLIQIMQMMKLDQNVIRFLTSTMHQYKTTLVHNSEEIGDINIRRGIYQGDSLSPLLFIMSLFPLTKLLSDTNKGYKKNKDSPPISHLWFVDDLKLFAKNEAEMDSLVKTVETYSKDIGMSFGIKKCNWCMVRKGEITTVEDIETEFGIIKALQDQDDDYKYLGIMEKENVANPKMKNIVAAEYKRRSKLLLRTSLNAKNLIQALNTFAVPVIRYSASILEWTQEEIKNLDRKTRKWMAMLGAMNLNSDVDRLYAPRSKGGKGLISICDVVRREKHLTTSYLNQHKEDELLKNCSNAGEVENAMESLTKKQVKDQQMIQHESIWKTKPLHGEFFRKVEENNVMEYTWLAKAKLKKETEALIMAAQEYSLRLNYIKFKIDHTVADPKCRMCHQFQETVQHIVCGCPKLAKTEYQLRHDRMGKVVHWALARKWGFDATEKYYHHIPVPVLENEDCKILWDFSIRTDRTIKNQRPDLTMVLKKEERAFLIDFSVPFDYRIEAKTQEKVEKYDDLCFEVKRLWKLKRVETVPIIIGALGSMNLKNLNYQLTKISLQSVIQPSLLQKETLLGTGRILRKVLNC
jgi:hypothetical protein